MNDSNLFIELKHVSKILKKKEVLSDINIGFEQGEIYGIIGANASGKTMLLRAIAGLIRPSRGEVLFSDPDTTIGVIIENPGFLLTYTGYENLSLLAGIRNKIGKEEIIRAMERVGLRHDDKRKVKEYSLGMKQRLALAQAIMEQPRLMLLDEPTRGLDQDSVDMIRKLLLEMKQNGTTIILSSHNKEDISTLCSRIYEIQNGRIQSGP